MDVEKIKGIFIEEASEIIESLDVNIINLEDNPADKEYLNSVFRGVHTLKGSANSFGFTRLGTFVHSFEDLLDYYRTVNQVMPTEIIDLCLESVDLVKELFEFEINEAEGYPGRYSEVLDQIHAHLEEKKGAPSSAVEEKLEDLSGEFGDSFDSQNVKRLQTYQITFTLDDDIYIRGLEPLLLVKTLLEFGTLSDIKISLLGYLPELESLETNKNYLQIRLLLRTETNKSEIEESFIYLDESEFLVSVQDESAESVAIDNSVETKSAEAIEPTVQLSNIDQEKKTESKISEKKVDAREEADTQVATVMKSEQRTFVKVDTQKLDELFDSVGELVIAQNYLSENKVIKNLEDETVEKTMESLNKITRLVQNRVMSLRMVPIRDSFEKMKRVVREASKQVNKKIEFVVRGEETEIDKTIVDKLADPLIHLIRNAIDHGLETDVHERQRQGKKEIGVVTLEAFHKGGNIIIQISDDGRGIDKDAIFNQAVKKGLVDAETKLSEQQIYMLLFKAGFSTAAVISDISGRGVGLDVVRSNVESIRGKIEIETAIGKGSTFRIVLPLTLAIIDGMLVKCSGEIYILPTLSVSESFTAAANSLHTVKGKGEFVQLRNEMIPLVRLNVKLELNDTIEDIEGRTIICVENERGKVVLFVDELVGRQQVVVKSIGHILKKSKEISGGAVLGNGDIALILNVDELS